MATGTSRQVLRYLPTQRFVHWMGAAGFVMLLLSGLILLWPPLSPLAAGGWSRLLHRVGAVLYILWPILYAILNPKQLSEVVRESLTYGRDEWKFFLRMPGWSTPSGWQLCRCRCLLVSLRRTTRPSRPVSPSWPMNRQLRRQIKPGSGSDPVFML